MYCKFTGVPLGSPLLPIANVESVHPQLPLLTEEAAVGAISVNLMKLRAIHRHVVTTSMLDAMWYTLLLAGFKLLDVANRIDVGVQADIFESEQDVALSYNGLLLESAACLELHSKKRLLAPLEMPLIRRYHQRVFSLLLEDAKRYTGQVYSSFMQTVPGLDAELATAVASTQDLSVSFYLALEELKVPVETGAAIFSVYLYYLLDKHYKCNDDAQLFILRGRYAAAIQELSSKDYSAYGSFRELYIWAKHPAAAIDPKVVRCLQRVYSALEASVAPPAVEVIAPVAQPTVLPGFKRSTLRSINHV